MLSKIPGWMTAFTQVKLAQTQLLLCADLPLQSALSLAPILMCHDQTAPPCGQCTSCKFQENTHPDLHILQPETPWGNIKIESVRDLQENLYVSPMFGKKKVFIISPVHRMTLAAQNALLKILEEPPESAYFILTTQELGLVLPTIVSRCQRWLVSSSTIENGDFFAEFDIPQEKITALLDTLLQLKRQEITLIQAVRACSSWENATLLEALYRLHSQAIHAKITGKWPDAYAQADLLMNHCSLPQLFRTLDALMQAIKNIHQQRPYQMPLLLSDFFRAYISA
ncbi:MAG: hypothetical protein Q8R79_08670 [Legionellaceae bacterium]|nr:hypothetical protein [Legionellaceae bacterium]